MLFVSCLDEDCCCHSVPGTIDVTVMDKNYDNVDEIAGLQKLSESLPFASYLTDLVVWRHAAGAAAGESFRPESRPGDLHVAIDTAYLVPGANELVVLGNEPMPAEGYAGSVLTRELHPGADEYVDLYIGSEDIESPVQGSHIIRMFRTKGKLLVRPEGIPSDVVEMEVTADNLYRSVGRNLVYSDSAGVVKRFSLPQSAGAEELSLFAAPGRTSDGQSGVTVRFAKQDGSTVTLSNIRTNILRNRISVIRPVYDPDADEWTLDVLVDGSWARVEDLQIY